jgi:hypothetical protein
MSASDPPLLLIDVQLCFTGFQLSESIAFPLLLKLDQLETLLGNHSHEM